jgi:undecaprenyl-diphosphatase
MHRRIFASVLLVLVMSGMFITNAAAESTAPLASVTSTTSSTDDSSLAQAESEMNVWKAFVLGAVEGITEFLPISSTGHLVVTQRWLGIGTDDATKDAADSYAIAIQFGAILAILLLYRRRIVSIVKGIAGKDEQGRSLFLSLLVAFLPAVVIGVAFEGPIKDNLLGVGPVIAAWIVGGVVLLVIAPKIRASRPGFSITEMSLRSALIIGLAQVVAMWPGTSRSLVTILAALAVGATLAAAVEFSFLLGLITLGAATLYEAVNNGSTMIDAYGWFTPLVGLIAAFIFAALAVKWMVAWLQTRSLAIFGIERIAAAALAIVLVATSVI